MPELRRHAPVARWSLTKTAGEDEGYTVELGIGSFGAAKTLCPGLDEALPKDILGKASTMPEVDGARTVAW